MTKPISVREYLNIYRLPPRASKERHIPADIWYKTVGELPHTEYRFSKTRAWRFDYAFVRQKVAVEIHGGLWLGKPCPVCKRRSLGRHNRPGADMEKLNAAQEAGWIVLQYTYASGKDPWKNVNWIELIRCVWRRNPDRILLTPSKN